MDISFALEFAQRYKTTLKWFIAASIILRVHPANGQLNKKDRNSAEDHSSRLSIFIPSALLCAFSAVK